MGHRYSTSYFAGVCTLLGPALKCVTLLQMGSAKPLMSFNSGTNSQLLMLVDLQIVDRSWLLPLLLTLTIVALLVILIVLLRTGSLARYRHGNWAESANNDKQKYDLLHRDFMLNLSKTSMIEAKYKQSTEHNRQIVRTYSEEIRGPLRFIMVVAEKSKKLPADTGREQLDYYFDSIRTSTSNVFEHTEAMFEKSNNPRVKTHFMVKEELGLYHLVEELTEGLKEGLVEQAIWIENEIPESFRVIVEPPLFKIALNNLIQNAAAAMDSGSIRFDVLKRDRIKLLRITDSGRGMGEQELLNIMERLVRADENNEGGAAGSGLMIVRETMKRINGHMEIESEKGAGTVVKLFFSD